MDFLTNPSSLLRRFAESLNRIIERLNAAVQSMIAVNVNIIATLASTKMKNDQLNTKKYLCQYIVADPAIRHGKPTFRGTRIMVWQVLRRVARGRSWDETVSAWGGSVSKEAIAEAIALAKQKIVDDNPRSKPS